MLIALFIIPGLLRITHATIVILYAGLILTASCSESEMTCTSGKNIDCGPDDWATSAFILPYPRGKRYRVNQGNNNTCGGHQDAYRYGYDFDMPIGTIIIASKGGMVSETRTRNPDGEMLTLGNENLVKILHDDGTTMAYSHLKQNGVFVVPGQVVEQGDTLGLSGNSGYTDNFPHLHLHLSNCDEPTGPGCGTLLVKFNNTTPNPCGLIQNQFYEAL